LSFTVWLHQRYGRWAGIAVAYAVVMEALLYTERDTALIAELNSGE
jgi:hypothetical protein